MSKTRNKIITTARLSLVGSLSLVSMTVLSGMFLSSSVVSAEDIVDEINITVPVSCSLSGTGMTSHTATIENGRYVSDIGTTTLKAFCNDNNGFAIYANGYTGDTLGLPAVVAVPVTISLLVLLPMPHISPRLKLLGRIQVKLSIHSYIHLVKNHSNLNPLNQVRSSIIQTIAPL